MGVFSTDNNKLTLIYNSRLSLHKQAIGYVEASKKKVLTIDISKTSLTGTQWAEIAEKLNVEVADLINKNHPDFLKNYEASVVFETNDWFKVLQNHPETFTFPVLIDQDNFYQISTPSQIVQHIDPDSAGISRNPAK